MVSCRHLPIGSEQTLLGCNRSGLTETGSGAFVAGMMPDGQPAKGRSAECPTIQRLGERVLSHAKGDRRQVRVVRWSELGHSPTPLSMFPIWLGHTVFTRSGRDTMMVFDLTEVVRQRHLLDPRQRLEFNPMYATCS